MSSVPQSAPSEPKKSKAPWLIGCGALLLFSMVMCGVLAAIAVPAFQRSVNRSKESEAQMMLMKLATGAQAQWEMSCSFPGELPRTGDLTTWCGGVKGMPVIQDTSVTDALGVSFAEPMYFIYSTEVEDSGDSANYVIRAEADFECGGPAHTIELRVIGTKEGDTCTSDISPSTTLHEFE